MKIILLTGPSRTGKTPTFHILYDKLTAGMANKPPKESINDDMTQRIIPLGSPVDFQCRFYYRNKDSKKIDIALFSLGDTMYRVIWAIMRYTEVDYLVLAHSEGGGMKEKIREGANMYGPHPVRSGYSQHTVIPKTVSKTAAGQAVANAADCNAIIAAIK